MQVTLFYQQKMNMIYSLCWMYSVNGVKSIICMLIQVKVRLFTLGHIGQIIDRFSCGGSNIEIVEKYVWPDIRPVSAL